MAEPVAKPAAKPAALPAAQPAPKKRASGARPKKPTGGEEVEEGPQAKRGRPPMSLEAQVASLKSRIAVLERQKGEAETRATQAEARAKAAELAVARMEAVGSQATELAVAKTKVAASFFMLQAAQGRLGMPGSSSDEATPTARAPAAGAKPTPTLLEQFFEM